MLLVSFKSMKDVRSKNVCKNLTVTFVILLIFAKNIFFKRHLSLNKHFMPLVILLMSLINKLRVTWEHRRRYKLQSSKIQQKIANFPLNKRSKRIGAKYKFKLKRNINISSLFCFEGPSNQHND